MFPFAGPHHEAQTGFRYAIPLSLPPYIAPYYTSFLSQQEATKISFSGGTDKVWNVQRMECYSMLVRNELGQ